MYDTMHESFIWVDQLDFITAEGRLMMSAGVSLFLLPGDCLVLAMDQASWKRPTAQTLVSAPVSTLVPWT